MKNTKDLTAAVKEHAKAAKKKKPQGRTFADTCEEIREFNEIHGTHLTYGQYIGLRDFGSF